ncbi:MAG: D-2-hydroxyacid dehydrogenase [Blastocatellia bacterium]
MTDSSLHIWCDARLTPEAKAVLRAGAGEHRITFADEASPNAGGNLVAVSAPAPEDAVIAFGQPAPDDSLRSDRLRWVHLSSAGYTSFDRAETLETLRARGCALTTSSDVYAEPCAQHLLAMMLSLARQLPASLDNQRGAHAWEFHRLRVASRLLNHQTVLLLGFGHIARRFVELIAPLNMQVSAVRQRARGDEPIPVFAEEELEGLLASADHVVNILPGSQATTNFLNAERLKRIKRGAILYNIGRGATLDQQALVESLQTGALTAAYLDVTDPEPLPAEHPLWTAPNCYITAHTGGGHSDEMERLAHHFLENLRRFTRGEALLNRVV